MSEPKIEGPMLEDRYGHVAFAVDIDGHAVTVTSTSFGMASCGYSQPGIGGRATSAVLAWMTGRQAELEPLYEQAAKIRAAKKR